MSKHLERASALVVFLEREGFDPEVKHYEGRPHDDYDRWYVVVSQEGCQYTVQYNNAIPDGSTQTSRGAGATCEPADELREMMDRLRLKANERVPL